MRKIGSLPSRQQADRFCDYLLTIQIPATAEHEQNGEEGRFNIWVKDEDRLAEAASSLEKFRAAPDSRQFDAGDQAKQIREQQARAARRHKKLQRKMPAGGAAAYFANRPIWCTIGIIVISVLVSLSTKFERGAELDRRVLHRAFQERLEPPEVQPSDDPSARVFRSLSFVNIYDYVLSDGDPDPLASIRRGEIWRVITPMFLHGSMMHLVFNMMLFYFLGGALERLQGFGFMLGLTLFCQVVSALVQALMPEAIGGTPIAIGASGAGFGLFGYLWIRPLVVPSFPLRMPTINIVFILGFMFMAMIPGFPMPIANGAHVGGLLSGILVATIFPRSWHM